jgi:hypothetical protein
MPPAESADMIIDNTEFIPGLKFHLRIPVNTVPIFLRAMSPAIAPGHVRQNLRYINIGTHV